MMHKYKTTIFGPAKSILVGCLVFQLTLPGQLWAQNGPNATCNYPNDTELAARKANCESNPSKQWNCSSSRCLDRTDYQKTVDDETLKKCDELQEQGNAKAAAMCRQQVASQLTGVKEGKGKPSAAITASMSTLAILSLLFAAYAVKNGSQCGTPSKIMILGAGAVGFLGDIVTYMQFSKQSKKMVDKYKKQMQGADATSAHQAQTSAFLFLEKEQNLFAKHLDYKSKIYFTAGGIYMAAMITAMIETYYDQTGGSKLTETGCDKSKDPGSKNSGGNKTSPGSKGGTSPKSGASYYKSSHSGKYAYLSDVFSTLKSDDSLDFIPTSKHLEEIEHANQNSLDMVLQSTSEVDAFFLFQESEYFISGTTHGPSLNAYQKYQKEKYFSDHFPALIEDTEHLNRPFFLKDALAALMQIKNNVLVNEAHAFIGGLDKNALVTLGVPVGVGAAFLVIVQLADGASEFFGQFLSTGLGRIIISGVLGTANLTLGGYSMKMSKNAQKNAKKVKILKDRFISENQGIFDCSLESNKSRPQCFCYDVNGQFIEKNKDNAICADFLGRARDFTVSSYDDPEDLTNQKVCINAITKQLDISCNCQKVKDKTTGKNVCFTATPKTFNAKLAGTASVRNLIGTGNSLTSGTRSLASVNGGQTQKSAFNVKKIADNLAASSKSKAALDALNPNGQYAQKIISSLQNKVGKKKFDQLASAGIGDPKVNVAALDPSAIKNLEKAADQAEVKSNVGYDEGGSVTEDSPAPKKEGFSFDFDKNTENVDAEGKIIGDFMDKEYKLKEGTDIVKNPDAPLWKIISHRYQQSALPKLFGEDLVGPKDSQVDDKQPLQR